MICDYNCNQSWIQLQEYVNDYDYSLFVMSMITNKLQIIIACNKHELLEYAYQPNSSGQDLPSMEKAVSIEADRLEFGIHKLFTNMLGLVLL